MKRPVQREKVLIGICNQEISAFTFHPWSVLNRKLKT